MRLTAALEQAQAASAAAGAVGGLVAEDN